MPDNNFSLETLKRIYDDRTGDYLEIGPDMDGLDLIEIRSCTPDHQIHHRIVIHPDALDLVIQALEYFKKHNSPDDFQEIVPGVHVKKKV